MSYTINPNAKNRWARNAENTMDLSLETDASSVYLDNGRTLEQEIGEGSMVSNVATVDTSMSKVIDGTLDGAYESLMFKGKSLVNIIDYNKRSFNEGNTLNSGVVTINHQGGSFSNTFFLTPDNIKPSTNYFVIFNVISNTYENYINLMSDDDRACCFDYNLMIQAKTTGLHKMKVTSKSDLSSCRYLLRTYGHNNTNNGSCQYRVMVIEYIEGMENWDIPYFEGLCDVKMPILRNVGKNLHGGEVITNKAIDFNIGELYDAEGYNALNYYTPVSQGSTITISNEYGKLGANTFIFYNSNKEYAGFINVNGVATIPKGVCYVRAYGMSHIMMGSIQIEESSCATTYENHKTNILHTSEEIVLREVNGIQDTYNPLTGEYVRRIGEVVFDGSDDENWELFEDNHSRQPNTTLFKINLNNIHITNSPCICSDFIDKNTYQIDKESVFFATGFRIRLNKTKLEADNVSALKAFLQSNPIKVHYQLATPITTIIESLTTPFAYQNGHVILESGYEGQSLLPTLEYSTVANKAGLVENVAKTIQRQEKQLTMLEKMLIQNIINLDYNNTLLALKNEMEEML